MWPKLRSSPRMRTSIGPGVKQLCGDAISASGRDYAGRWVVTKFWIDVLTSIGHRLEPLLDGVRRPSGSYIERSTAYDVILFAFSDFFCDNNDADL